MARSSGFVQVNRSKPSYLAREPSRKALSQPTATRSARQERSQGCRPDSFPIPQPHLDGNKTQERLLIRPPKQKVGKSNNNGIDPQKNAGSSKDMRSGRAEFMQIGDKRRPRIG